MEKTKEEVFVYQIMDVLTSDYGYSPVNIPRNQNDMWLLNPNHPKYPIIRLNPKYCSTAMLEREYLDSVKQAFVKLMQKDATILVINTNHNSEPFNEKDVVQIVLTNTRISDPSLFELFPRLKTAVRTVSNNEMEINRVVQDVQNTAKKRQRERNKFSWKNVPKVSFFIIVAIVIGYLFWSLVCSYTSDYSTAASYVVAGAYYKTLVVARYEYWRILTTGFIQADLIILIYYAYCLYKMGRMIEDIYGKGRYALIFFVSLFVGHAFTLGFGSNIVSVGIGPGLFGIYAALLFHAWRADMFKNPIGRMQVIQISLLVLITLIYSGVSPYALLGGFVTGLFVSMIVYPQDEVKKYRIHYVLCLILTIGILAYGIFNNTSVYPEYEELNEAIVEDYATMGLEGYSEALQETFINEYGE